MSAVYVTIILVPYLHFRFAPGSFKPPLDTVQNVDDVWGEITNNAATVKFTRPISSTDQKDLNFTFDRKLLFARGNLVNNDISRHSFAVASNHSIFQCGMYIGCRQQKKIKNRKRKTKHFTKMPFIFVANGIPKDFCNPA